MEMIQAEIINLAIAVIVALAGIITGKVTGFLNKKGIIQQLENNREIVKIVVSAVEQMYDYLDGDEKLSMAKIEAVKLLNSKGIKMSDEELELIIESVVKEMKNTLKTEIKI